MEREGVQEIKQVLSQLDLDCDACALYGASSPSCIEVMHAWRQALEMRKPVYVIYGETRDMATDRAIRIMASKGAVVVDYDKLLEIFSDTEQSEKLKVRSKV